MPMPRNNPGDAILAAEWNLIADQIDDNTDDIAAHGVTIAAHTAAIEDIVTNFKARPDNVELGNLGATETITALTTKAQVFTATIDANLTLTVAGFAPGTLAQPFQIILKYDGSAQRTLTFVGVDWWDGSVPTHGPLNANQRVVLTFTDVGDGDVIGTYLLLEAAA